MVKGEHEVTAAGNLKPPTPEVYLDWILEACNGGVMKYNIVNSFQTCGITTNAHRVLQARTDEEAEAVELAELMAGFELDLDEDDVGNVSDAEVVDDPREEGINNAESDYSDDSEF
ncbi:hypothetical protein AAVH_06026 [Aphelenchoides avenae]|nr:hypothetical protein AAVH_06026 [Aphelenchus avenae]